MKKKKITLMGMRITIIYQDRVENEEGNWLYGETKFISDRADIYISTKDVDGEDLPKDCIDLTLRHELFHVILGRLYFDKECENETLVEWLATGTQQLNKQGLNI